MTDAIAEEVTALWLTDEVRAQRLRVRDEIRQGHWFFEQSLLDVAPRLVAEYRERFLDARLPLASAAGSAAISTGTRPQARTPSRRRSTAHALVLERYRSEVRALAAALGLSSSLTGISDELAGSIARDERELADYAAAIGTQNEGEPYRRKLSFVWRRLGNDGYASPQARWTTST